VSLKKTKTQLIRLLGEADNNVIALSGKWGTGKTHLWNEVKDASTDDKITKALYVSLFGLSTVDQVKRKLIEAAIPGVESHGGMFDGLKNLFEAGVKAASEHYKCWRRLNFDHLGVRRNTWTGLCHKSEARSVFERTE
jgi:Cdc6-like AAA superfamily ATPase